MVISLIAYVICCVHQNEIVECAVTYVWMDGEETRNCVAMLVIIFL